MNQCISIFLSKEEMKKFNKLSLNQQRKITQQMTTYFDELVEKEKLNKKRNLVNSMAQ